MLTYSLGDSQVFDATRKFLAGVARQFRGFRQAVKEKAMSRVYGGIHFPEAVHDGQQHGRAIGRDIRNMFHP